MQNSIYQTMTNCINPQEIRDLNIKFSFSKKDNFRPVWQNF